MTAPSDKRLQSLAVGCTSEPPPGAGGIRQLEDYTDWMHFLMPDHVKVQMTIIVRQHSYIFDITMNNTVQKVKAESVIYVETGTCCRWTVWFSIATSWQWPYRTSRAKHQIIILLYMYSN